MTSAERIEAALATTEMLQQLIAAHVRASHPDWSDEQVGSEVAARFLANAG